MLVRMASSGPTSTRQLDSPPELRDSVDALLASWAERRPDLDFRPVGIVARLERLRGHLDVALNEVFTAHRLTAANFAVLVTLARIGHDGRVSQRRLMDELDLTSGTISVRIDRLVAEGLVDRRPDPESKRNTLITLTTQGRELFERVVPAHLTNEQHMLCALDDDEQRQLAKLLRKLLIEFEGIVAEDRPGCLGLTLAPPHLTIAMRESVGLPGIAALLVREVIDSSPAARASIRPGDILTRAGAHDLRTIGALHAAIYDARDTGAIEIALVRGTSELRVDLDLDGIAHGSITTGGRIARGEHRV